jgi:hypothetical protein
MKKTNKGLADRITLPNGKYAYVGVGSVNSQFAKKEGMPVETVKYCGNCDEISINARAHRRFHIKIDGVKVADFLDKIATEEEVAQYLL